MFSNQQRCVLSVKRVFVQGRRCRVRASAAALVAAVAGVVCGWGSAAQAQTGTWTRVSHNAPGAVNLMLLLSDGTVIASNNNGSSIGRAWYKLTPDVHGSYVNGTWTAIAQMNDTRLYYSAQVLKDGRVFVAGGEYGTGRARAEVYNPLTNVWTLTNPPTSVLNPGASSPVTGGAQGFVDSISEILSDGRVLICPVAPRNSGGTVLYDPAANMWSVGPNLFRGVYQDEASWVKLPDGTILTIDPFGTHSERYNPASNTWINDSDLPVQLYDPFGSEMGAGFLLPDGRAWFIGATGHTAYYAPSGSAAPGVWSAGPDIPGNQGVPDGPAAMMVTGHVLCAVSPVPTTGNHFPSPTRFYDFNPVSNVYTSVSLPPGTTEQIPTYVTAMLDLPDGGVMYSHFNSDTYIYRPSGAALEQAKPIVTGVSPNGGGSYHVTGMQLNGISEGAGYGDDAQMASNYPLVRFSDMSGNVYYARTFNWSSTGVMTGSQAVTTEYIPPASLPAAQYTLTVVTNGVASDPFCTTPWITGAPQPQSSCVGGSAMFSVGATGSALSYEWRRTGGPLSNGGNIAGADTPNLIIDPITPADAGADYYCVISNGCGSAATATVELTLNGQCPPACYANCDESSAPPILNVNDFTCFLNRFASGDSYANCDGSTTPPVLNVNDFTCFLNQFATGCN